MFGAHQKKNLTTQRKLAFNQIEKVHDASTSLDDLKILFQTSFNIGKEPSSCAVSPISVYSLPSAHGTDEVETQRIAANPTSKDVKSSSKHWTYEIEAYKRDALSYSDLVRNVKLVRISRRLQRKAKKTRSRRLNPYGYTKAVQKLEFTTDSNEK
jgi:hypothetical protein